MRPGPRQLQPRRPSAPASSPFSRPRPNRAAQWASSSYDCASTSAADPFATAAMLECMPRARRSAVTPSMPLRYRSREEALVPSSHPSTDARVSALAHPVSAGDPHGRAKKSRMNRQKLSNERPLQTISAAGAERVFAGQSDRLRPARFLVASDSAGVADPSPGSRHAVSRRQHSLQHRILLHK